MFDYIPRLIDINEDIKTFSIKQGDNNSRKIFVTLKDRDNPNETTVNLDGCTVRAYFALPDGSSAYVDGAVESAEDGVISVTLPSGVTAQSGTVLCEINISDAENETLLSLHTIKITVIESIRDVSAIEASDEFTALDNALIKVDAINARIDGIIAGETSGDVGTELADARKGYDGTAYGSVGTAIREQITAAMSSGGATPEQAAQIGRNTNNITNIQDEINDAKKYGDTRYNTLNEAIGAAMSSGGGDDEHYNELKDDLARLSHLFKYNIPWKLGSTNGTSITDVDTRLCFSEPMVIFKNTTVFIRGAMTFSVWEYANNRYTKKTGDIKSYTFENDMNCIIIARYNDSRTMTVDDAQHIYINRDYEKNTFELIDGILDNASTSRMSFDKIEMFEKGTCIKVGNGILMAAWSYSGIADHRDTGDQIFQNKTFHRFTEDTFVRCSFKFSNAANLTEEYKNYIRNNIFVLHDEDIDSRFRGKTIAMLGDSITAGVTSTPPTLNSVYDLKESNGNSIFRLDSKVAEILNVDTILNYGVPSSTIAENSAGVSGVAPFINRYASMSDADYIIVFGGVNDAIFGTPIGTIDDTSRTTFCGALNILLNGLIDKYIETDSKIFFIAPLQSFAPSNRGNELKPYVDAVKMMCTKYAIPCLDLYEKGRLNMVNDTVKDRYFADGTHPTGIFNDKFLGAYIAEFVKENS